MEEKKNLFDLKITNKQFSDLLKILVGVAYDEHEPGEVKEMARDFLVNTLDIPF